MNTQAISSIAEAALERVNPRRMMTDCLTLTDDILHIRTETDERSLDLSQFNSILVLGAGKATARMAAGLEDVLGERITDGLISVKYGHVENLLRVQIREAGHPVPDESGVNAAQDMVALAEEADEKTLCLVLISGGGSALLPLPLREAGIEVTLADMQATTQLLLRAGTPIQEINCIRKHISGISGGRICRSLYPATTVSLILSDVVGDELESIASGLTSPDTTTFADAVDIARRYEIYDRLPESVREVLEQGVRGDIAETPKPGDEEFARIQNILIGTNALALEAARSRALELGYNTFVLTSQLTGEAREIAKFFAGMARDLVRSDMFCARPACILAGGETTVTLKGSGKGGRNQEMALAFLGEVAAHPDAFDGVTFLSTATDGNDGPTDAAGAFASAELARRAAEAGLSIAGTIEASDSYHFYENIDALYKTGPTNTNVCDVQILIVE
ncbi:MAG: glycerate kinase [Spirochaetaceae bacterium]|nr:MAG: glycerate kinase [Spirochaetaceae bacterium]